MQNMSQPPAYQGPPGDAAYQTDKIIGIIIMVLALCGVAASGLVVLAGTAVGALGAGAAASNQNAAGAAAAGAAGGMIMLFGVLLIILSLANFAVGYGVMKSLRWGFTLGLVVCALRILVGLGMLGRGGFGVIGWIIDIGLAVYFFMRFTGRLGPALT